MKTLLMEVLGVAWGYRVVLLALLLFRAGSPAPMPWTLAQMASCVILAALLVKAGQLARRDYLTRRYGWAALPGGIR